MPTKSGAGLGVPVLVALRGGRNTRGGTIVVGAINLGGAIKMIPNAIRIADALDARLGPLPASHLPDELGPTSESSSTRTGRMPFSRRSLE